MKRSDWMNLAKRAGIVTAVLICAIGVSSMNIQMVLGGLPGLPPPPLYRQGSLECRDPVSQKLFDHFDYKLWAYQNDRVKATGTLYTYWAGAAEEYGAYVYIYEKHWFLWWWYWAHSDDWRVVDGKWETIAHDGGEVKPFYLYVEDKYPYELNEYRIEVGCWYNSIWGVHLEDTIAYEYSM